MIGAEASNFSANTGPHGQSREDPAPQENGKSSKGQGPLPPVGLRAEMGQ